jgi:hypothetical protein
MTGVSIKERREKFVYRYRRETEKMMQKGR